MKAIEKKSPDKQYNLVSLLIGVNNQYQGQSISNYKSDFELLLDKAIAFAGGDNKNVVVISIPDYGVTPFGQKQNPEKIASDLEEYNNIARSIANNHEVSFVNITPHSKKALTDTSLIAADGLHPSAKMYGTWVKKALLVILPKLK